MHDFKIVMTGPGRGEVFMDGEMVEGVCGVEFRAAVNQLNTVTLTFNARNMVVEGVADVTTIGDGSRKFEKVA